MIEAGGHDSAQDLPRWVNFLEALGLWEFDDATCLTDSQLIQLDEKYEPYRHYFRGPSDLPEKPPLVRAIQLLLREACWWRRRKPGHKRTKLPPNLRKAVRVVWHRHGRPPFPELCRQLIHDLADYHRIERDLKTRRERALNSCVHQLEPGELVGRLGVWRNGRGTFASSKHADADLLLFVDQRRIITANNWVIRRDLGVDEEDKDAVGDLMVKREALARLLASRASYANTELQGEPVAPPGEAAADFPLDATSEASIAPEPAGTDRPPSDQIEQPTVDKRIIEFVASHPPLPSKRKRLQAGETKGLDQKAWESQRLQAAKSNCELKGLHITQRVLRLADRELRKRKEQAGSEPC
jgi:hypothetical protein